MPGLTSSYYTLNNFRLYIHVLILKLISCIHSHNPSTYAWLQDYVIYSLCNSVGHCSFVSALLALGSRTLLSVGWDCHLLFWQDIEPIRLTDREVLPIEDSQPQTGFKLGPSTIAEYLPLSVCGVSGFGVLVLFTNTTGHVDISYYTFLPTDTS